MKVSSFLRVGIINFIFLLANLFLGSVVMANLWCDICRILFPLGFNIL